MSNIDERIELTVKALKSLLKDNADRIRTEITTPNPLWGRGDWHYVLEEVLRPTVRSIQRATGIALKALPVEDIDISALFEAPSEVHFYADQLTRIANAVSNPDNLAEYFKNKAI